MTTTHEAAFREVGPASDLEYWPAAAFYVHQSKQRICVARVNEQLYAFDDLCTLHGCSLSAGLLKPDEMQIMCQCGGCHFDVTDGRVMGGPATHGLRSYAVRENDGAIEVQL